MDQKIERTSVANVERGQYIVQEDDPELTTDGAVNDAYDASEQDWQHVVHARHHADISNLTLAMYNGELHQASGTGVVWRLVDGEGRPVEYDPDDRDDIDA